MPHQLAPALNAINRVVADAFSQCRKMGGLLRAPFNEESAVGERLAMTLMTLGGPG
jgi:hypothetical protein